MNMVYRTFTKSALKKRNVISEETIKFSSTKVQCSSSIRACFSRYYVCCLFFVEELNSRECISEISFSY